jgi:formylglycine-generating enzyme required for sulfatase activity
MLGRRRPLPVVAAFLVAAAACGGPTSEGITYKSDGGTDIGNGSGTTADGKTFTNKSRSCTGGIGADSKCGGKPNDDQAEGSTSCCDAKVIPGGTFHRFNDADFPATVSSFALDTFEVTVGRFRAWVEATNGNLRSTVPAEGAGAHPKIPGSGWRSEWNKYVPSSRAEVDRMLGPEETTDAFMACQYGTEIGQYGALTWWTDKLDAKVKRLNGGNAAVLSENTKAAMDRKPLNCVPWHVLFAFCVWDGGRLPTDAEFSYAMSGGNEQRPFPWGKVDSANLRSIEDRKDLSLVPIFEFGKNYASARLYDKTLGDNVFEDNYSFTYGGKAMGPADNAQHIAPVGRKPLGNGKWGHADLAGGMFEWMLDEGPIRPGQCNDCANVNWPKVGEKDPKAYTEQPEFTNDAGIDWWQGGARSIRGSAWDNAAAFANGQTKTEIEYYTSYPVLRTYRALGGRCARDL